ncbi:MAG: heme-binding protein [Pseudomonadota bacterium]|nr:MAG: heme-binding protein [Pseudomonadota bacterium]
MRISLAVVFLVLTLSMLTAAQAQAADAEQPVVVNIKRLSLESALAIAQAAIDECRKAGVQVAVTVVDRGGHSQVVLRDVLAMDLTLPISYQKAYTAMSFNTPTSALQGRFKSPVSIAKVDNVLPSAGGVPVQAGGTILGGVGVSGAPSGKTDEQCARAGVEAVAADLEMADID